MTRSYGLLLLLVFCVCFCGCASRRQTLTRDIIHMERMQAACAEIIPPQMPIHDVIRSMEVEGFTCEIKRDAQFAVKQHWSDDGPVREHIDFIRCHRTNSNAGFMMGRVWNVAILLNGDQTSGEILVSHYVDGP